MRSGKTREAFFSRGPVRILLIILTFASLVGTILYFGDYLYVPFSYSLDCEHVLDVVSADRGTVIIDDSGERVYF